MSFSWLVLNAYIYAEKITIMKKQYFTKTGKFFLLIAFITLFDACRQQVDVNPEPQVESILTEEKLSIYKSWLLAVDANQQAAGARKKTVDGSLFDGIPLWRKTKLTKQGQTADEAVDVPVMKIRDGKMRLQKLLLFRSDGRIAGYRMEYQLKGSQKKGVNGSVVIYSLDESEQKVFTFKEGILQPFAGRAKTLGGTLNTVICRAFRTYQIQIVQMLISPVSVFFSVEGIDPNGGGAPGDMYGVADPIDDLIQAIKDFWLYDNFCGITLR